MHKMSPHFLLATWFGTGLSPKAPGTIGTLATLPLHFALLLLPQYGHLAVIILITILGTLSANKLAHEMKSKDPQIIVVDESAGVLLALWTAGATGLASIIAATLLFRLFDILKPWPISAAEKLRPAGIGIMADDLVAGLFAGLLTKLIFSL